MMQQQLPATIVTKIAKPFMFFIVSFLCSLVFFHEATSYVLDDCGSIPCDPYAHTPLFIQLPVQRISGVVSPVGPRVGTP